MCKKRKIDILLKQIDLHNKQDIISPESLAHDLSTDGVKTAAEILGNMSMRCGSDAFDELGWE